VTTIQNDDFIVAGGASSQADFGIVAGGALLASGAESLTYNANSLSIFNADIIYAGDASSEADLVIVAGGAELLPGANDIVIIGGRAGEAITAFPEAGIFELAGSSLNFVYDRIFEIEASSFVFNGSELTGAFFERSLLAETRVFELQGFDIKTRFAGALLANSGLIGFTGTALIPAAQRIASLDTNSCEFEGYELSIVAQFKTIFGSGVFQLQGAQLSLAADKSIRPTAGSLGISGTPLLFDRAIQITASSGQFLFIGYSSNFLQQKREVSLQTAVSLLTGSAAFFSITKEQIFGNRRPTARRFQPGSHSFSSTRTISGNEVKRLWGNTINDARLELEYENISEGAAYEIIELYEKCYGDYASVFLPSQVWAGAESSLSDYLSLSGNPLKWYFAEPPKIRSVRPGICNLSVKFDGKNSFQR
jgi:hypothetical protein